MNDLLHNKFLYCSLWLSLKHTFWRFVYIWWSSWSENYEGFFHKQPKGLACRILEKLLSVENLYCHFQKNTFVTYKSASDFNRNGLWPGGILRGGFFFVFLDTFFLIRMCSSFLVNFVYYVYFCANHDSDCKILPRIPARRIPVVMLHWNRKAKRIWRITLFGNMKIRIVHN